MVQYLQVMLSSRLMIVYKWQLMLVLRQLFNQVAV